MAHIDPTLSGKTPTKIEKILWSLLPLSGLIAVIFLWIENHQPAYQYQFPWFSLIDLNFLIYIDGLSLLMLSLITGIGCAVYLYAAGYFADHPQLRRLYVLLTVFMLAMIGCVISDHLLLFFLFWELTSITSFLLVLFNYQAEENRNSAKQALLITGSGGLCLLAGFLWLWHLTGTAQISEIITLLPDYITQPHFKWILVLILLGAFTKSAQFPFQFWLPNAMAAPTPVSAYLHSATMVKLGIFLLARLDYALSDWALWQQILQTVGSLTAAWGMMLALRERDLKKILAWSTVASLGTMVVLIGLDSSSASIAVVTFVLAHALYKAPLFFVAGNIDHATGTRIIDHLGGLKRYMPWTATVAILAALSMAGMPTSFGFIAKEALAVAKEADDTLPFSAYGNIIFSIIAVAVAAVAAIRVFWQHPGSNITPHVHEVRIKMLLAPALVAIVGLFIGLTPQLAIPFIKIAAQTITPDPIGDVDLYFNWEALQTTGLTILATVVFGLIVFHFWDNLHHAFDRFLKLFPQWGGAATYTRIVDQIPALTSRVTGRFQHGLLSGYIQWILSFTLISLTLSLIWALVQGMKINVDLAALIDPLPNAGLITAAIMISVGAICVMLSSKPFILLLNSGLVGFGSALLFVFVAAPDVAFTQFVVETILVIILASILIILIRNDSADFNRPQDRRKHPKRLVLTLLLAVIVASIIVMTIVVILGLDFDHAISDFYIENSVPTAYGRNIINVILVDFRALDTFGEVAVMLFSLLAARPLLRELKRQTGLKRKAEDNDEVDDEAR
ncbi:hydrogen gas-evolving membrane-bound hydrogenase subunit E [Pasteurella testudinis]|uniref:hydrogen gas-evolving membrane-bound hydrogenase subunit E n=1 Tax=Pasteurella testudinis TaxID=761 RepID=UPI0040583449